MALIKRAGPNWSFTDDPYTVAATGDDLPHGPVAVSLAQFESSREILFARNTPVAVILNSDQSPEPLARHDVSICPSRRPLVDLARWRNVHRASYPHERSSGWSTAFA